MLLTTSLLSSTNCQHVRKCLKRFLLLVSAALLLCSLATSRSDAQNSTPDPSTGTETVGVYTVKVLGSGTSQAGSWDMASASFNVSVTRTADGTDATNDIAFQSHTITVSGGTMDTASGPDSFALNYAGDGASATFTSSTTTLPTISTEYQCISAPSVSLSATITMKDGTTLNLGASVNVAIVDLGM